MNLLAAPRPISDLSSIRIDRRRWPTLVLQSLVGTSTAFIYLTNIWLGPLNEAHGWDFSTIALTFTLISFVGLPASIIAGRFLDRWGSKIAIRVGGIGYAVSIVASSLDASVWFFVIGMGVFGTFFMYFAYLGMLANVGELFPDRRGFALGFTVAAANLGGALIAPIAEILVRSMGVSESIAVQGVLYGAVIFLCSFLIIEAPKGYRPAKWEEPLIESSDGQSTATARINQIDRDLGWKTLLITPSFWLFFFGMIFATSILIAFASSMTILVQTNYGVDAATGAWLYTLFAIGMGVGALAVGLLSDKAGPLVTFGVCSAIVSLALLVLVVEGMQSLHVFAVVVIVCGLVMGGGQAVIPNVLMTAFGEKNFGINFGFVLVGGAIAAFIGSQLAVSIDGKLLFSIGAASGLIGFLLIMATRWSVNRKFGFKVIR